MTRILTRQDVEQLMDMEMAVEIVEAAFKSHGYGRTRIPHRSILELDEFNGMMGMMPAYLADSQAAGVKIISHHAHNHKKGLPEGMGLILYHDPATGMPLAIMDCAHITAMRTGAATAVSVKYLGKKNTRVAGIVGTGVQAVFQVRAICQVSRLERVKAYDLRPDAMERFAATAAPLGLEVELVKNPEQACREVDILATCTSSRHPFVKKEWLQEGVHIAAIGADMADRRELSPQVYGSADKCVTDLPKQALLVGEITDAIATGAIDEAALHTTLGEIVAGKAKGRENDAELTIFKSTGMAIQDIAVAKRVYELAIEKQAGVDIAITP
ncbi:MAG: ornithine cyclodeaminase family protein [Desulfobacteraceae bacterium]|nr:ornithine cyclodeaminase family protein [Desulfobacteraceae bacterium]